jgi:UDP-N-acetylglucosamine--N-acetylmuramyl-(pentapeptide) pyrophosphoryl-undecaprenol N-acetylglucosamine transferase
MEMEKVPQAGYEIKGLDIAGFDRSSLIKNISLPFKLLKSFGQVKRSSMNSNLMQQLAWRIFQFPVLKYAHDRGISTFIHESNSFAGKAISCLVKMRTKVFVATEGMEKFFPVEKIVVTGNPVRKSIVQSTITRDEAIKYFGLIQIENHSRHWWQPGRKKHQ